MTSQTWRVQPTTPPSHAVIIDGWHELPIDPPNPSRDRTDLIAERPTPTGREYQALTGTPGEPGRPLTPPGWTPIATIHIPPAAHGIVECMIGEPE